MKNIVYFFCTDTKIDPVANNVLAYLHDNYILREVDLLCEEHRILSYKQGEYQFYFVPMNDVLSHNYDKYLSFIKENFSGCDLAAIVNWHAGDNAPDCVLTVHSTGDVPSGVFAPSNPVHLKAIFQSLEYNRNKYDLSNFRTLIEATHWSGIPYGQKPELISEFGVPIYDIEIGSTKESWENTLAIKVLAESLLSVDIENVKANTIIGVGGKHFEACFSEIIMNDEVSWVPGHILPNQWVANDRYLGDEGKIKFRRCIDSIQGDVKAVVFHDNLKGVYKQLCRDMAAEYQIPCCKHKILKNREQMLQLE